MWLAYDFGAKILTFSSKKEHFAVKGEKGTMTLVRIKDQLILKCPFGVFKSLKKPTKFLQGFLP